MVKHVVMFRFKDEYKSKMQGIKQALESLEEKIPELLTMETGINQSERATAYDLVLISVFNGLDELNAYRVHPEHQKIVEKLKIYTSASAVVDYTV